MKNGFSLLELIFAIVVLAIIASFAVPKYLDTKDAALASTIRRDVNTAVTSIQSYYLLNQKIEKLSDAMNINDVNWTISDLKIADKNSCLTLEVKTAESGGKKTIELVVDDENDTNICKKIRGSDLVTKTYEM